MPPSDLSAIKQVYDARLDATGSETHAFLACVEAFREMHPALSWTNAAVQIERILERTAVDARLE